MAGVFKKVVAVCFLVLLAPWAQALTMIDYASPRNNERPARRDTYYIILHTTEGSAKGSLRKVHQNGEAHYFIDTDGKVYRIIHRDRVAYHCGRSMWNGRTCIDEYAVGIELVGYHNRDITAAQYAALRELLVTLKKIYKLSDDKVLTHSMVAYGAPNRWHKTSHRGRKRCGMLFATDKVRAKLGLTSKPAYDPDVRARRLAVGDPELARILYGGRQVAISAPTSPSVSEPNTITKTRSAWDIARERYKSPSVLYTFPDGKKTRGDQIKDWSNIPVGTKVTLGEPESENEEEDIQEIGPQNTACEIARDEYKSESTLYLFPGDTVKKGSEMTESDFKNLPVGTKVLVGYIYGGQVAAKKSAFDICGKNWNLQSTYYLFPNGTSKAGNNVDAKKIPPGTKIFYRK